MSFEKAGGGPGEGIFPSLRRVRVRFTEAADAGDCVMFDTNNAASGTYGEGGDPGSDVLNTVRQTDASAGGARTIEGGLYGLAEEAQAIGSDGWAHIRGKFTKAAVSTGSTAGDFMTPQAGSDLMLQATGSTGGKFIALCAELAVANLSDVLFNGIEGLGTDA